MSIEALREAEAEARAFLNIESERRARYGWNGQTICAEWARARRV